MHSLIYSILRAAATDDDRLSLETFNETQIRWAIETGLGPLLYHLTKANPATASSPFKSLLLSADLTARVLSQELLDAMSEIIDVCKAHGTRVTLLKGVSICEQYYPEPHLRLMRDIDFLVDAEAYACVESVLLECGYRKDSSLPADFYENHHHGIPLYHPRRRVWVEIHKNLVRPESDLAKDRVFCATNIQSQRQSSVFRGREVDRLSDELQIVYIAAHGAKELNRIGGIVPMLDLIFLLKRTRDNIDWDRIFDWLQDSPTSAQLLVMLTWLDRSDLISVDRQIMDRLSSAQSLFGKLNSAITHGIINTYIVEGRHYGKVLTKDNIAIVWRTLLSPGPAGKNLLLLPWNVIFPPTNPLRFSPNYQLRRIKSALGFRG